MAKKNILLEKTFGFACSILDFHSILKEKRHYEVASQLVRSGTSVGVNAREAQRAESKADFRHKLRIALKEADETRYWLELINKKLVNVDDELLKQNDEIIRILVAIINSSLK